MNVIVRAEGVKNLPTIRRVDSNKYKYDDYEWLTTVND